MSARTRRAVPAAALTAALTAARDEGPTARVRLVRRCTGTRSGAHGPAVVDRCL